MKHSNLIEMIDSSMINEKVLKNTFLNTILRIVILTSPTFLYSQFELIKDINPGKNSSLISNLTSFNNKLYFLANDGLHGSELWVTDGSKEGTKMVKDINQGKNSSIPNHPLFIFNNILYFIAYSDSTSNALWKSDGSLEGTVMALKIGQNTTLGIDPFSLVIVDNELTFLATDDNNGQQLWTSDGSSSGTFRLTTLENVKLFKVIDKIGSNYIFQVLDSLHNRELWVTDGTPSGTKLLKDINPGNESSLVSEFIRFNGMLLFTALDSNIGYELWKTDGTSNGTVLVKDIFNGPNGSNPDLFTTYKNKIIFKCYNSNWDEEIWETDGTEAGTKSFIQVANSFKIFKLFPITNKLFVEASNTTYGREAWVLGDSDSLHVLVDINPGTASSLAGNFCLIDSLLYFSATDENGINSIWVSNVYTDSTYLVQQVNPYFNARPKQLTAMNKYLYFTMFTNDYGDELYTNNLKALKQTTIYNYKTASIYPNPAKSKFSIQSESVIYKVVIYNSEGKKQITIDLQSQSNFASVDVHNLPSGLYIVETYTTDYNRTYNSLIID